MPSGFYNKYSIFSLTATNFITSGTSHFSQLFKNLLPGNLQWRLFTAVQSPVNNSALLYKLLSASISLINKPSVATRREPRVLNIKVKSGETPVSLSDSFIPLCHFGKISVVTAAKISHQKSPPLSEREIFLPAIESHEKEEFNITEYKKHVIIQACER